MMRRLLALAAAAAFAASRCAVAMPLDVVLTDSSSFRFSVALGGVTWLDSGVVAFRANDTVLTSSPGGGLTLASLSSTAGVGPFGPCDSGLSATWDAAGAPGVFVTSVCTYTTLGAAVFTQSFPQGLVGTSAGSSLGAVSEMASAFPSLGPPLPQLQSDLAYLTFAGGHCPPHAGRWTAGGVSAGAYGPEGGAVTALYNASGASLLLSPLSDPETSRFGFPGSLNRTFAGGFNGALEGIPAGYTLHMLLAAGDTVKGGFGNWGSLLLRYGGKRRTGVTDDFATAYLSYWTDNGAYYYYNAEPNKTYEQTILDALAYIRQEQLPVRSVQFDSWWYYKNPNGLGLLLWEPLPSVFPDLMQPWTALPLALHNRYFDRNNNYSAMGFEFITEPGSNVALPIDEGMFRYMMGKAKDWGMTLYEQDWQNMVFTSLIAPHRNITAARTWLRAMGDAASSLGVTIQYCLAEPAYVLASAAAGIQAVTNVRASGDYHPGDYHDKTNHWNTWDIKLTSIFFDALGLQPSKDVFWTTTNQPGNPYGPNNPSGDSEPNPFLHTLAAVLSTGPVGFGDGVGYANVPLIASTCRAGDGLLLKPDAPAKATESALLAVFNSTAPGAQGEFAPPNVTLAYSAQAQGAAVWYYALAVSLPQGGFPLTTGDMEAAFPYSTAGAGAASQWVVLDWFNTSSGPLGTLGGSGAGQQQSYLIPAGTALPDPAPGAHDLRYLLIAPVLPGGWILLGETGKLVPMSAQRATSLVPSASGPSGAGFSAQISLGAGESSAVFEVLPPSGALPPLAVTCASSSGATNLTLSCWAVGGCSCE